MKREGWKNGQKESVQETSDDNFAQQRLEGFDCAQPKLPSGNFFWPQNVNAR